MAVSSLPPESNRVTFARSLGCFDASMIGIGAMIGAGIFVLTGIAAGEAGPASILAFALNGLVTLMTAFCYAELASAIPEAGGGYSFVKKAFPGPVGFLSGWMLWFAYTVACSLYALGFAGYFWEFFHKYLPDVSYTIQATTGVQPSVAFVTVIVSCVFVWLNVRGTEVTGKAENVITMSKILVLLVFVWFGLAHIFATPVQAAKSFSPFFPKGLGGVLVAMGLTFIAFEGYDLIATVAEEIKQPEINIPKATFVSLGVTVVVYLLIVFVSLGAVQPEGTTSWEFLGRYQETAIVKAADSFMPAFGVATIVFGGLLSTMSALNATVLASSRVAFSMGRDRWLPVGMAAIHSDRRTPHIAILVTGAILTGIALLLPIHVVGSAASLMFLLTFTLVNLSLLVLRRRAPEIERRYRVPLFPWLPLLGAASNMLLAVYQFRFDPMAWYVALGWIAVGFFAYTIHFRKESGEAEPHVLDALPLETARAPYRVLVPVANPGTIESLLDISLPIAKARSGDLIVNTTVEVPIQLPIQKGMKYINHRMPLLRTAQAYAQKQNFRMVSDIRVAHRVDEGILSAISDEHADLLVIGWKGFTTTRERIFGEVLDRVVNRATADVAVVKLQDQARFDRILLPTAGGPHTRFAVELLEPIVAAYGSRVTACSVIPEDADAERENEAMGWIDRTLRNANLGDVECRAIRSRSVPAGIVRAGAEFDLIVMGSADTGLFQQLLFGEVPDRVGRFAKTSVMLVKQREGRGKAWLRRLMS